MCDRFRKSQRPPFLSALILLLAPHVLQAQLSARQIAAEARPAVVTVGALVEGEVTAFGSGFFIREDGVLVTNLHVVQGADSLRVLLESGEIYDNVHVLARDERRDLIILQIPATGLPVIIVGDDRASEIGDSVYVIGNPLGLEGTFSDGLISSKRMEEGVAYIQITAPISEGSSGGPVLNASGEAIGIATLTFDDGQNLNIAVPARYASGLLVLADNPVPFESLASELQPTDAVGSEGRIDIATVLESLPSDVRADIEPLEPWQQQVLLRAISIQAYGETEGWEVLDEDKYDLLETNEVDSFDIRLPAGEYVAVGVCDDDCSDLDLVVFGPDDEQLARDVLVDALPTVEFTASRRDTYRVDAKMVSCSTGSCMYGILLFRTD